LLTPAYACWFLPTGKNFAYADESNSYKVKTNRQSYAGLLLWSFYLTPVTDDRGVTGLRLEQRTKSQCAKELGVPIIWLLPIGSCLLVTPAYADDTL
jgi:hypothetical protein